MNKKTLDFLKTLAIYLILVLGLYFLNNPFEYKSEGLESKVEFVYQEF